TLEPALPTFHTGGGSADRQAAPSTLGLVFLRVFANPTLWTLMYASLMIGFVRLGVIDHWWPKYFANGFGVDPKHNAAFAPYLVAAWGIAAAGIVGGILFGLVSDRLFGGRRAPVVVIAFVGQSIALCG